MKKWIRYIDAVRGLKPGVTMMIMHCTRPTEVFDKIDLRTASLRRPQSHDRPATAEGGRRRAHRAHDLARADGTPEEGQRIALVPSGTSPCQSVSLRVSPLHS